MNKGEKGRDRTSPSQTNKGDRNGSRTEALTNGWGIDGHHHTPGSRGRGVEADRHHQGPQSGIQDSPKREALRVRDKGEKRWKAKGCPLKRQKQGNREFRGGSSNRNAGTTGEEDVAEEGARDGGAAPRVASSRPLSSWR